MHVNTERHTQQIVMLHINFVNINFWPIFIKVARLQSEFCTKDFFFSSYEFSHEKCSEISPEMFEPLFCGSAKIPQNCRQISCKIFPPQNQKKIHRRASAGAPGGQTFGHQKKGHFGPPEKSLCAAAPGNAKKGPAQTSSGGCWSQKGIFLFSETLFSRRVMLRKSAFSGVLHFWVCFDALISGRQNTPENTTHPKVQIFGTVKFLLFRVCCVFGCFLLSS